MAGTKRRLSFGSLGKGFEARRWLFVVAGVFTFLKTMPFVLQVGVVDISNPGDIIVPAYFYYRFAFFLAMIYMFSFLYPEEALKKASMAPAPIVLGLLYLASSLWAADTYLSFRAGVEFLSCLSLAYFLNIAFSARNIAQVLMHVLGISLVLSILWVLVFPGIAIHSAIDIVQEGHEGDWRGIYLHKNTLGLVAGFTIPPMLAVGRDLIQRRWLWLVYLAAAVVCVVQAHSGTGMTLTAFGLAFVALLSIPSAGLRAVSVGVMLLVSFVGLLFADTLVGAFLELLGKDPTLTGRTTLWETALSLIAEKPILGHGYPALSDPNIVDAFIAAQNATNAHDGYLHVMVESGVAGLIIWMLSLYRAVRGAGPALRQRRLAPEIIFFLTAIAALLIAGITEIQPFDVTNSLLGVYLLIAVVTLSCLPQGRGRQPAFRRAGEAMTPRRPLRAAAGRGLSPAGGRMVPRRYPGHAAATGPQME